MEILTSKEVARYFRKSVGWVYNHFQELGGFKVGGLIFFTQEGLTNAIQRKQEMAGRGEAGRAQDYKVIQYAKRGRRMGGSGKELEKEDFEAKARRYGLDEFLGQVS